MLTFSAPSFPVPNFLGPNFPSVDPIPLPAPVWLMKVLHILTLTLHFVAVEMLLGGLLVAVVLSLFRSSPSAQIAARSVARRLTVVMTYVINLAVPPLLFAQVLYGRALYTSSVLIGIYWIAVVALVTLVYGLLYHFKARLEAGRSAWVSGLAAWLLAGSVARLLSTNMTLMLRPEVWQQMYSASGAGAYLPSGDVTLSPRWWMMLCGGLAISGLWLVYLGCRSSFTDVERRFLATVGGRLAAVGGVLYLIVGVWAASVQPLAVKEGLRLHPLYHFFGWAGDGWLVCVGLIVLLGLIVGVARTTQVWVGWLAVGLATVTALCLTIYRDGVRDLTLLSKGYDVWDRVVVTNWGVVGVFLALFVGGLAVVGWLISVVARANKTMEGDAQ